jgi:hypothetical protein
MYLCKGACRVQDQIHPITKQNQMASQIKQLYFIPCEYIPTDSVDHFVNVQIYQHNNRLL